MGVIGLKCLIKPVKFFVFNCSYYPAVHGKYSATYLNMKSCETIKTKYTTVNFHQSKLHYFLLNKIHDTYNIIIPRRHQAMMRV